MVAPRQSKWRVLKESHPSAFRNLAIEEAIARTFSTGIQSHSSVRLWTNPKATILGRFQEAANEVNLTECYSNDCQIARRFTGGGTVFHDERTLNFSILREHADPLSPSFQTDNLRLILHALTQLGIKGSISPPNSILVEGRKVCGAAAAVGKNFVLWHCSILVDTNLKLLELTLTPNKASNSRFVRSKWQPVTTLSKTLSRPVGLEEVAIAIERSVESYFAIELEAKGLSREEQKFAEALYLNKYSSDEWNIRGNLGFAR
jgi:lipoate-protein ligase A